MRIIPILLTLLLILPEVFAAGPSWVHGISGSVYKWTDDEGNVQYTQYPPANKAYEQVERASVPAGQVEESDTAAGEGNDGAGQSDPGVGVTVDEQNKQNCITATNNLILLENPLANVTYVNPEGKTVQIDSKEKAARIEQARKNIAEYCK